MSSIPQSVWSVISVFEPAFTRPTFRRFVFLILGAVMVTGSRTVSNILRLVGLLAGGHPTTYHHVFSSRRWKIDSLCRALCQLLVERFAPRGQIRLAGDDTVLAHPGRKVFGKGRHRDAVRSSHRYTAFRYGHKWVVLSLIVTFPFTRRPWALPIMIALYTTPEWDKAHGRRHKTQPEIMEGLLAKLMHWYPKRRFLFVGDAGFATKKLAKFAQTYRNRLVVVSRFRADAALYGDVMTRAYTGRPRRKGERLPTPNDVVTAAKHRRRTNVSWYGGGRRRVSYVTGQGLWYGRGEGPAFVSWIHVRDLTGTHRDEYFFTTDPDMSPEAIISAYTSRWSIEVTFQEVRSQLAIGSTRCRIERAVLREVPCLFALYSIIAAIFAMLPARQTAKFAVTWPGKVDTTFADGLAAVRRLLWRDWFFASLAKSGLAQKWPPKIRETLLTALCPAA